MIAVCVVAVLLGLYRAGPFLIIVLVLSLSITAGLVLAFRHRPGVAAWVFSVFAALANLSVALVCAYLYSLGGLVLIFLASILLIPLVLGPGTAWALDRDLSRRKPKTAAWVLVLTLGISPLTMMFTLWPLHVAFALSRASMDKLADRVAAGETLASPEWAGLYWIVDAKLEPRNGNVGLIIDADPAGRSGFVRVVDPSQTYLPMVNLNFNEPVGGTWRYQNED